MVLELINNTLSSIEHVPTVNYYWIAFFAALFETTIGIGLFLPGSSIILFLGAVSSQGNPDVAYLLLFSILGAITGDNLNYYLGRNYGAKWLKDGLWLLQAKHIENAKCFMNAHGAKSIFLGRFIPSVKEVVPFIAGSVKMNRRTFIFWNVLGAIGWGCEWVLVGYFFAQSINLAEVWLSRAGLFLAFLLIFGSIFYLFKWFIIKKGKH